MQLYRTLIIHGQWMFAALNLIYMIMNLFIVHVLSYGMPLEGSNQCLVEEVVIGPAGGRAMGMLNAKQYPWSSLP